MRSSFLLAGCVASVAVACSGDDASPSSESTGSTAAALGTVLPVVTPRFVTPPIYGYDEAPRTPDSDDPAVWIHPTRRGESLVIGVLKDAGLQVYDLKGRVVQTIVPPHRPPVSAEDPAAPGTQPDPGTGPCPESEGDTYGRFNNVDVQYGFTVFDRKRGLRRVDVAVVTDRGCDRVRVFEIDPSRTEGPLLEITSPSAPRVFPERTVRPSPFQSPDDSPRRESNPLDDQSTAYGLTSKKAASGGLHVFVTQRSRTSVAELLLVPQLDGTVSYRRVREFQFPALFAVEGNPTWTPCREDAADDPQLEGLVVDQERNVLYAAQEMVGVWEIPLGSPLPAVVNVPVSRLIQRTRSFGAPYFAVPDDDEFACEPAEGEAPEGTIAVPGGASAAGEFLNADVEGLAIYYAGRGGGYLLVSSQGDDTFHVFERNRRHRHLGAFVIEGTGETDGHDVVNLSLGPDFRSGLFVVQNGRAPEPEDPSPINGYEFDNATQFELVGWDDIAARLELYVDTWSYDPRR